MELKEAKEILAKDPFRKDVFFADEYICTECVYCGITETRDCVHFEWCVWAKAHKRMREYNRKMKVGVDNETLLLAGICPDDKFQTAGCVCVNRGTTYHLFVSDETNDEGYVIAYFTKLLQILRKVQNKHITLIETTIPGNHSFRAFHFIDCSPVQIHALSRSFGNDKELRTCG